jgi:hypothetical protein
MLRPDGGFYFVCPWALPFPPPELPSPWLSPWPWPWPLPLSARDPDRYLGLWAGSGRGPDHYLGHWACSGRSCGRWLCPGPDPTVTPEVAGSSPFAPVSQSARKSALAVANSGVDLLRGCTPGQGTGTSKPSLNSVTACGPNSSRSSVQRPTSSTYPRVCRSQSLIDSAVSRMPLVPPSSYITAASSGYALDTQRAKGSHIWVENSSTPKSC